MPIAPVQAGSIEFTHAHRDVREGYLCNELDRGGVNNAINLRSNGPHRLIESQKQSEQMALTKHHRRTARFVASAALTLLTLGVLPAKAQSAFTSDDFNRCGGVAGQWSFVAPAGPASSEIIGAGTEDAHLLIRIPGGVRMDAWNQNQSARLMQPCADQDFSLEMRIDSIPSERYQIAGVLIEQDESNWLRFDYYSDGARLWSFCGSTLNGQSSLVGRTAVQATGPLYVRVTRTGNSWLHERSLDGQSWDVTASFDLALTPTAIGPFAGNAGPAPAFDAQFDYLFDMSAPVVPEDGNPVGGPLDLTTLTTGAGVGAVQVTPAQATYSCGDLVTLEALPDGTSAFSGWSGGAGGNENPLVLTLSTDTEITARFEPAGPPVLTNVSVAPSAWGATVTWDTNKPSTSRVDFGTTTAYGTESSSSNLVMSHQVALVGLTPDTGFHFQVTSVDGSGVPSSSSDQVFQTLTSVGPFGDDFNDCGGLSDLWTVEDPVGGAVIETSGVGTGNATLRISLPEGVNRDAWFQNRSTRVLQPADDDDFTFDVAFESIVDQAYQMQGLIVEADAGNWLRFDFYSNGGKVAAFAAATVDGSTSALHASGVTVGVPLQMRVERTGNHWTQLWSDDSGLTWNEAAAFDHEFVVSRVGLFAGTAGASPAFDFEADYFWRSGVSLFDEDSAPVGGPYNVNAQTTGTGTGSITIDPPLGPYACGQTVTLTATPDAGSLFSGWQGSIDSLQNPLQVSVDDDLMIDGRFDTTAPPVISNLQVDQVGTASATITWQTNMPSTSQVDYGPTPALSLQHLSGELTTEHSVTLSGLDDATAYSFIATSTDWLDQATSWQEESFTTLQSIGPVSEDFNRCAGLAEFWTIVDPVGDALVSLEGAGTSEATVVLDLPAGSNRDAWGDNNTVRIVQPSDDEDLELEASFLSVLTARYQMQGIYVEQDEDNWLRLDFYSDGSQVHVFAARTTAGTSQALSNIIVPGGTPLSLRVVRTGDEWSQYWSSDGGSNWNLATSFPHAMNVQRVGLMAGTPLGSAALRMEADYLIESRDPLSTEDGPIDTGPFTITLPNDGSVIVDPLQAEYACGQVVRITAIPATGMMFSDWNGVFAGLTEDFELAVGADLIAQPAFVPTPAPQIVELPVLAGSTSGLIQWQTDVPADSQIEYGLSSAYGSTEGDLLLRLDHQVQLTGLLPATTYHYRITSASNSGLPTSTDDRAFTTNAAAVSISTDFNQRNMDLERWSCFQDPKREAALRMEGAGTSDAHLVIEVPAGTLYDLWTNNDSARAMQLVEDADLDVAVKIESVFDARFQLQGIVFSGTVEEDDFMRTEFPDFIRTEFHHDGTNLYVFASTTAGGFPQVRIQTPIASGPWNGAPLYLRVKRVGNTWTLYHAFNLDESNIANDAAWVSLGSFEHEMMLTAVGPFVGSAGNAPAHVGRFDWFQNVLDPVATEDSGSTPDTSAPHIYRDSSIVHGPTFAMVEWMTDERATGTVRYGLTEALELGQIDLAEVEYEHRALLTMLQPETAYHYQITSSDGVSTQTAPPRMLTTTAVGGEGPGPIICLWYADRQPDDTYNQSFGQNGLGQPICNLLGNVCDAESDVVSLTYSLNGGPATPLSWGPDRRRLLRPGDFNIDLPIAQLNEGLNTVLITSKDDLDNSSFALVNLDLTTSVVPSAGGTIDWDSYTRVEDAAQVVDGKWTLSNGQLSTVEQGYDRLLAFGDHRWSDYEVEVPLVVHAINQDGFLSPSYYPLVGFVLRWPGHSFTDSQPNWGYEPLGALAVFRWTSLDTSGFLELLGNFYAGNDRTAWTLEYDVPYTMKGRVTTNPDGTSNYKLKLWPTADPEPDWTLDLTLAAGDPQDPNSNPATGGIGLVSHHVCADFGDLKITRLDNP